MVRFLYQCVNQGKKLVLLSKHEGNLKEELHTFRLDNLFDEIIHIDKESDKVGYIHSDNALFIDDSNAERVNVKNQLKIPVFSPEMIDVLSE